ncbi:LRR-RLK Probable leucine-rich repeat receptor-like serine/threonine-protein kinase [Nymphaea thermarum]|nr:LRR-RLK Probable leucine-rich repeat receptor-like serine/threonine-protein kinase [Nymphaea thermarum]
MEAVAALQQIGKILGKTDWDFSVDPCSGKSGWMTLRPPKNFMNEVGCDCNDTVCHVTRIDLTRNYLSGPIPPEWGSLRLVNVSLMSNRLSGPIPAEIGNMISLKNM